MSFQTTHWVEKAVFSELGSTTLSVYHELGSLEEHHLGSHGYRFRDVEDFSPKATV